MVSVACGVVLLQLLQLPAVLKLPEVTFDAQLKAKLVGTKIDKYTPKVKRVEKNNFCIMLYIITTVDINKQICFYICMLLINLKLKENLVLVLILLLSISFLFFSQLAIAATTATVAATVTVQNVSVSVSSGTVSYGTLSTNTSAGTNGSDTQTATNNGNVAEDLNITGQNSANWTLGNSAGTDTYVHQFCTATCASAPTNYTKLTTSYAALGAGNLAANGTKTFDLYITTPTSSSVSTQQSVNVTVQAVAH